jgi:uncharacterized surface protein with fasciclin (FAS1) repeats
MLLDNVRCCHPETVVDVAIDNNFTSLVAAVAESRSLVPALSNPLTQFTVFAPTDAAFTALATASQNTDINGLLALPNLADVLKYHVLGSAVKSSPNHQRSDCSALELFKYLKTHLDFYRQRLRERSPSDYRRCYRR